MWGGSPSSGIQRQSPVGGPRDEIPQKLEQNVKLLDKFNVNGSSV